MKNKLLVILIAACKFSFGQLSPSAQISNSDYASFQYLDQSGEKIFTLDTLSLNWIILNPDGTNYKTGTLPNSFLNHYPAKVLVTEKLLDNDLDVEILIFSKAKCEITGGFSVCDTRERVLIVEENGNTILDNLGYGLVNIFNSGTSAKMILKKQSQYTITNSFGGTSSAQTFTVANSDSLLIYDLPGQLNCSSCAVGTYTLINDDSSSDNFKFKTYPNPVKDEITIEYSLPADSKDIKLIVRSIDGKLIREIQLKDYSGKLNLNTLNLQSGVYLYQIFYNNKDLTSNKVIIIK
jgi:hypothetical protein